MTIRDTKFFLIGTLRDIIWTLRFLADYTEINRYAYICDISQVDRQGSRGFLLTSLYQSEILSGENLTAK